MSVTTITYLAECDPGDAGGSRSINGSAVLDTDSAAEGSYIATTTYFKMFGASVAVPQAVIFYNSGTVDLAVRVNLSSGTQYVVLTCPPGGILLVPQKFTASTVINTAWTDISIKCYTGTCTFDYCVIR